MKIAIDWFCEQRLYNVYLPSLQILRLGWQRGETRFKRCVTNDSRRRRRETREGSEDED
jgi:hypothetical protein